MTVLKKVKCSLGMLACLAALVPEGASAVTAGAPAPPGLMVEEVRPGTAGQKAGLLPGDILVSWRRGPAAEAALPVAGELALPFDLAEVFLEQMPRAEVTLLGRRGAEERSWVLPQGAPSVWVRTAPVLSGDLLDSYREARARFETPAGLEAGATALRGAAARARSRGAEDLAVWFLARAADELAKGGRWEEADTFYNEALALHASRAPAVSAQLYREWASLFYQRFNFDRATELYERALAADRRKGFGSLTEAWSLAGLALMDVRGGGSQDEAALYRQSIEIRHRLAPGSAEDARGWLLWGHAEALREQWGPAAERYQRAVAILAEQKAARLLLIDTLRNLARVLGNLGEAEAARQTWLRAQSLLLEEAPEDPMMASITQGLGLVAAGQGELGRAEELLGR
ncbi:MAG TPA: hypothetical protein VHN15_01250, partial [Thermoanaerobaculia bacterium]|nr:hypothetical protein [Thermoanaerobaculia bacterium]